MTTYPIDPTVLRRAAEQLRLIDGAGCGGYFNNELECRTSDQSFRDDRNFQRYELSLAMSPVRRLAERLSQILDCPIEQATAAAIEALEWRTQRSEALQLLAEMSQQVRKQQAGRRS